MTGRKRTKGEQQIGEILDAGITAFACLQVGQSLIPPRAAFTIVIVCNCKCALTVVSCMRERLKVRSTKILLAPYLDSNIPTYPFHVLLAAMRCTRHHARCKVPRMLHVLMRMTMVGLQAELPPQAEIPVGGVDGFLAYAPVATLMAKAREGPVNVEVRTSPTRLSLSQQAHRLVVLQPNPIITVSRGIPSCYAPARPGHHCLNGPSALLCFVNQDLAASQRTTSQTAAIAAIFVAPTTS